MDQATGRLNKRLRQACFKASDVPSYHNQHPELETSTPLWNTANQTLNTAHGSSDYLSGKGHVE